MNDQKKEEKRLEREKIKLMVAEIKEYLTRFPGNLQEFDYVKVVNYKESVKKASSLSEKSSLKKVMDCHSELKCFY
jgi:hypothetical protein